NHGGYCIRQGIAMGAIDPKRPIFAAESDSAISKSIERDLIEDVGLTDLRFHHGPLHRMKLTEPVDTVFVDLMGTINTDIARWMHDELAAMLTNNATVSLTVAYNHRNAHFMEHCNKLFHGPMAELTAKARSHYGVNGRYNLIPLMVMRCIFNRFNFAFTGAVKYGDGMSMLLYRFDNFERLEQTNGFPSVVELIESMKPTHAHYDRMAARGQITRRSAAAYKANLTRQMQRSNRI
ncbi:MAG: hypothetical protein WC284_17730, partial [Candidimonas sp.]